MECNLERAGSQRDQKFLHAPSRKDSFFARNEK